MRSEIADVLGKTVLSFDVRSGPTGVLFGSVTTTDIADEIWRTRKIRVDRKKIETDSIKRIGRYSIPIHLFEGVTVEVKTLVVPEGGELPPEEELQAMEAADAEAQAAEEAAKAEQQQEVVEYLEEEESRRRGRRGGGADARRGRRGGAVRGRRRGCARGRAAGPSRDCRPRPRSRSRCSREAAEEPEPEEQLLSFPRGAPQACGAPRELPAASGENATRRPVDGVVGDVRTHGENGGNMCSFRCKSGRVRGRVSVCEYTAIDLFGLDRFVSDMVLSGSVAITHVAPFAPHDGHALPAARRDGGAPLYDENAEMAVVGSVLRSETAVSAVIEHIGAGDFYLHHLGDDLPRGHRPLGRRRARRPDHGLTRSWRSGASSTRPAGRRRCTRSPRT